jgi:hypothetical protein
MVAADPDRPVAKVRFRDIQCTFSHPSNLSQQLALPLSVQSLSIEATTIRFRRAEAFVCPETRILPV